LLFSSFVFNFRCAQSEIVIKNYVSKEVLLRFAYLHSLSVFL